MPGVVGVVGQTDRRVRTVEATMATFAVTTARGNTWDPGRGIREQQGWDAHADYADGLVERGVVIIGGPVESADEDVVGLLAIQAADADEIHAIFAKDPWVISGVLRVKEVRHWRLWLDSRR
jgi:uncharacterized protein YciI